MTQFDFQVEGLDEIIQNVEQLRTSESRIILNDGLREIGRVVVPSKGSGPLADATPRRTGKLARSTFFQITGPPESQILEILQPAQSPPEYGGHFYGAFVRGGTRAHDIKPRIKKVLRFEVGGREVFSRGVKHPGTDPNPYHVRTLNALSGSIQQVVNKMGQRIVATLD